MNYQTIVDLALSYADREDTEVIDRMDGFLRMVESRINKRLQVWKMTSRAVIDMVSDQEYYGLPCDFSGMRDIEVYPTDSATDRVTPCYLNPEQMNTAILNKSDTLAYTIIADQIHITPQDTGKVLEIVYYSTLPELSAGNVTNWLSSGNPDIYVFGLLVEINSFVKDGTAADIWNARFMDELSALSLEDQNIRWSGTPLVIRTG